MFYAPFTSLRVSVLSKLRSARPHQTSVRLATLNAKAKERCEKHLYHGVSRHHPVKVSQLFFRTTTTRQHLQRSQLPCQVARYFSCHRSPLKQQHQELDKVVDRTTTTRTTAEAQQSKCVTYQVLGNNQTLQGIVKCNVEITIDDNRDYNDKLLLNLMWLRHSCRCHKCTHEHSRQRLYDLTKLTLENLTIVDVDSVSALRCNVQQANNIDNSNSPTLVQFLEITWQDGHVSRHEMAWLTTIARNFNTHSEAINVELTDRKPSSLTMMPKDDFYAPVANITPRQLWNVNEINRSLESIDFNQLLAPGDDTNRSLQRLASQLVSLGIAKIENVPQEKGQILRVVRRLAYERPTGYGLTFDVVVEPSEKINLAYSAQEFDLHVDLPYREFTPGVQLLHCIQNSQQGGENYFCDAFKVAAMLRDIDPNAYEVLRRVPVLFSSIDPYRNIRFRRECPIISERRDGELEMVHYSPWMLPPLTSLTQTGLFYSAYMKFTQLMHDKSNKLITKMNPGDLYIFHNRRVFHGRNQYDPAPGNRLLQGCYMDWDEILGLHERIESLKMCGSIESAD